MELNRAMAIVTFITCFCHYPRKKASFLFNKVKVKNLKCSGGGSVNEIQTRKQIDTCVMCYVTIVQVFIDDDMKSFMLPC